jgi:hypothetical protein
MCTSVLCLTLDNILCCKVYPASKQIPGKFPPKIQHMGSREVQCQAEHCIEPKKHSVDATVAAVGLLWNDTLEPCDVDLIFGKVRLLLPNQPANILSIKRDSIP